MRIVAALGGNALLRRGEPMTAAVQARNVRAAGAALAPLITAGHQVAITHGNGPQIGLLAERDARSNDSYPLDVLGAETDGMIGYLIERELAGALTPQHLVVGVLTQIRVDRRDPAFRKPTKPIGPTYDEATARRMADANGWTIAVDGKGWRRVVPSPPPLDILEARAIELLLDHDVTVICCGGGGIPVAETETGTLEGVEAVIDKDHASALLARLLGADMLLLLTDVAAVQEGWGTPDARPIAQLRTAALDLSDFPEGSMRPKVEAAMAFVNETGRRAAIGRLEDVAAIVAGEAGTQVTP
ncbi:MAG: carbamate kinase [Bauldia sp.]|nr:carbamate kinase [Bauldia sp.]